MAGSQSSRRRSRANIDARRAGNLPVRRRTSGGRPLDKCGGYAPEGCWEATYTNDDIFFLESCLYSMVCANNEELFALKPREPFHCRVSERGFRRLQTYLTWR